MKKSGVILTLLVISILMMGSVSFVSAIWVTGKVIENETETTNETEAEETNITETIENVTETQEETNVTEPEPQPELRPEIPPETCADKIKIDFGKQPYYVGDHFKVIIEVFDSLGNRLPYYPFYFQTYTYEPEGMWHTPEQLETDRSGYFISEGIIEKSKMAVGKTKHKIYTPDTGDYANCNPVEYIAEAEIIDESEPVPCGIGTCIPEGEEEEPEEIPEDKILYKCNGCELEGKCYPMGYRKEGRYCSENYEFVSQIDDQCDNNFECKSNVCISGECIGEGLIKRILKWFKKLFGGDENEGEEEPGLKMCSKLLIEKNIGDYEYFTSEYGKREEHQIGLFSEDGEQTGIVKCCVAGYKNPDGTEGKAGIVCPFDNKKDVENSLQGLLNNGDIVLGEYKGQKLYRRFDKPEEIPEIIVWTNKAYIIASGVGPGEGPLSEEVADAYLKKYPNDMEDITG